ncbi:MAG: hydrogenase iron-sulfur subunit [Anaerolineae bacterium]|nr:hydrogenase iron-sulfur subunit [Anaerolineae bacterium]
MMTKHNPVAEAWPEIVVLYCQHCLSNGAKIALAAEKVNGLHLKTVMMPCSSKVQVAELFKILDNGADGVEVVACPEHTCQFLVGSRRAEKRIAYAQGLLQQAGISRERLGLSRGAELSAEQLIERAVARAEAVRTPGKKGDAP